MTTLREFPSSWDGSGEPEEPTIAEVTKENDPRIGQKVAGYEIEERIATGPIATVYRAASSQRQVAVKIYPSMWLAEDLGERVRREQEAQRRIEHPSVARLLERGSLEDGSVFLVSEWLVGKTLEEVLGSGPKPWRDIESILASVGDGLGAIHQAGIVHRDLKPSNILVPASGLPAAVILDFGHSLIVSEERLTSRGLTLGSAHYMAPEQAAGRAVDGRADLYSLGVILYRALTGYLPFDSKSSAEVLQLHQTAPVVSPRERAPKLDIPSGAVDLCLWLLAKDPLLRVPNARVFAITLAALSPRVITGRQGTRQPGAGQKGGQ